VAVVVMATVPGSPAPVRPVQPDAAVQLSYIGTEADAAAAKPMEGQLLLRHYCLFLQTPDGPVDVAWAPGYSADHEVGSVVLRDADGSAIARVGDWVRIAATDEAPADQLACSIGAAAVNARSGLEVGVAPAGWPSEEDFDLANRFDDFASYPKPGLVTFFSVVDVGVGHLISDRLFGPQVLERDAWFAPAQRVPGVGGQLSPLGRLSLFDGKYKLSTTHHTCTGDADVRVPRALQRWRVLSYEPPTGTPCDQWYAVDVYLDDGDRIKGVMVRP